MSFITDFLRNAKASVLASTNRQNKTVAEVTVEGDGKEFTHRFPTNSRVSKALEEMTPQQLEERLDGGHFFFINGALHDFRDGHYNGFMHDDEAIAALQEHIGIRGSGRVSNDNTHGNGSCSKIWSEQEIQVPGMDSGGVFKSRLTFAWNPFIETIRSSFDIERLVCANGMMGLTSLFNARIPLLNRWEEHLDIADKQIQNKLYSLLSERFSQMVNERATLADCLRLRDHANERADSYKNGGVNGDMDRRTRLQNIRKAVDPSIHLGRIYTGNALSDRRLAAQLPSHLTMFDAYNIATEISSHTTEVGQSSRHGLDKFANELVFDRTDRSQHAARFGGPSTASFSDPDQAFFGDVDEDDSE